MTITLDIIQTLGLAVCVYMLGRWIKNRVTLFQKYFIPAPVIGGLICSILIFIGKITGLFTVEMTGTLQDFFMNIFFTGTGFTCSLAVLKKSGKLGAKLAVGAVLFLVVQNLVGVSLAGVFGLNKLLGVAMGSISMSGGVGSRIGGFLRSHSGSSGRGGRHHHRRSGRHLRPSSGKPDRRPRGRKTDQET